MSAPLPEPLVSADVDLRGLQSMSLDVARLMDSDLFALSTGEEFKAAVALWCKSWSQIPGGSLPDDDRILAYLSGAGKRWHKVREMALRGFIKCSDGRLYHPVVAEKVLGLWEKRLRQREKGEKGNAKRWGHQVAENADDWDRHGDRTGIAGEGEGEGEGEGIGEENQEKKTNTARFARGPVSNGSASDGDSSTEGRGNRKAAGNGALKAPISAGLEPNDRDLMWAKKCGIPEGPAFNRQWLAFKAHHVGKGDLSLDWHAEFTKWLMRGLDMKDRREEAGYENRWDQ